MPGARVEGGGVAWVAATAIAATAVAATAFAEPESRFQTPRDERPVERSTEDEPEDEGRAQTVVGEPGDAWEQRLYLSERPDVLGAAARSFHDEALERMLELRQGLVVERRQLAIRWLEAFLEQEPATAPEMPDAMLRLAELQWEQARAQYLEAFAGWQRAGGASTGTPPPQPDYRVSVALYQQILTRYRDFERNDLVLFMLAFARAEAGSTDEALRLYRRILAEYPRSRFVPDAHMALAEARFVAGDYQGALAGFDQVLSFTESELFGLALFKSAWCLWRMDRSREAATRFRRVLDLGRRGEAVTVATRRRLRELENEALEYLIQLFTEDESNTAEDLFAFLEEIGGERYADRVLSRLSARFYEQGRWERGIGAYRLLLERLPADERAPTWQLAIARGHGALGMAEPTIEALEGLAEGYLAGSEWASQQSDPEVVQGARALIERTLRTRGMRWHELAQRDDQRPMYERAERVYAIYLEHFADSEHAYELGFYRGEILFHHLSRWADAGAMYLAAAQRNPAGRYTRDALYNAIGAFERVREAQLSACRPVADADAAPSGGRARGAGARRAPARERAPAADGTCAETENDRLFATAIGLYVERFPDDPDLPEILYRQGRLYYDRGVYDPAVRLFGQLIDRFPGSPFSVTAGELILESFNRARDFENIETWARRLKVAPAFANAESQRRLDTLIVQAVFARGEQLASGGDHQAAARAYLRAAEEFPRDERAKEALYNAGLSFQRALSVEEAAEAYWALVRAHPRTEIGARGAWTGAQMYESLALFRDAARFYEAYGERFPRAERAADALYNATLLRVSAGDHDEAVADGRAFLSRFARHPSADEVTFLIGRAHAASGRHRDAARVYLRSVRRLAERDRQVEANTRLAMALTEAGDERGAARALAVTSRSVRRSRGELGDRGLYYAAQARFMQAERILREFQSIRVAGSVAGLRQRLQRKSELLRRAATAFAEVVELRVAEWVTAALFQIGRSYELFAESLRDAPIPENLSEEEEMAYTDQLSSFIVPIEEKALEAYEGGYQTALSLSIYNRWTEALRDGLTRLNDVQYPPLREMGGDVDEGGAIPRATLLDALRRGGPTSASAPSESAAPTSVSARSAQSTPAQPTPAQSTPAQSTPAQSTSGSPTAASGPAAASADARSSVGAAAPDGEPAEARPDASATEGHARRAPRRARSRRARRRRANRRRSRSRRR